jgi:class 3 adenylate cyclase/pimeloyl-ACP methyl ester carboxylesterase
MIGDGPLTLVFLPGWVWNLELAWELPEIARFFEGLATFTRLVVIEKRGVGLSDRQQTTPTLEDRADDIRAVMDDAAIDVAAVAGWFDGAAMAAHFAATHPERVSALIIGAMASRIRRNDVALDATRRDTIVTRITNGWGTAGMLEVLAPSVAHDARVRTFWGRFERMSASPNAAAALFRWNADINLESVASAIRAPALALVGTDVALVPAADARTFAARIAHARYIETPGRDIYPFFQNTDTIINTIQEFLTGAPGTSPSQTALLTIAFTDIVASTEHATELGDEHWHDLLDAHRAIIRQLLARYDGTEIDTAGDGFCTTFIGPARAIRFACAACDAVRDLGIEIRAGIHTGEVERRGTEIAGVAVHIAARVIGNAGTGEVLVTSTVKDLVLGAPVQFTDRGTHTLKGVDGDWQLYAATTRT